MNLLRTLALPLVLALLSASMALPSTGCAQAVALLPNVIAAVTDGMQILSTIEKFVAAYFAKNPNKEKEAEVALALERARAALNLALRTAEGAKELSDKQVDAAFEDFKRAYLELLSLVKPYGVTQGDQPQGMHLRAGPSTLVVPEPMAFHPRRGL